MNRWINHLLLGIVLAFVVLIAAWTVCYHLTLAAIMPVNVAWWIWLPLALVAIALLITRVLPYLSLPPGSSSPLVALLIAAGASLMASGLVRPDDDDVYYLNRTAWVAEHRDFPTRDTMMSDEALPALPELNPPIGAIEALLGWVANVAGFAPGDVVYVWVPPIVAFLSVLAVWILLLAWDIRRPTLALLLAQVFLVLGGREHASFGNLWIGRMWQGKVIMLCLGVPLMYLLLAIAARRYSKGNLPTASQMALPLAATSIASVGLTSSAVFVMPLVVVAAAVPIVLRAGPVRALAVVVPAGIYPVGAGLVVLLGSGERDIPVLEATNFWTKVVGGGLALPTVIVALLLVVAGSRWAWVSGSRSLEARLAMGAAGMLGLILLVIPVQTLAIGVLGPVAWRLTWAVPLAALVGSFAGLSYSTPFLRTFAVGLPMAVAASLSLTGTPIWAASNHAHWASLGIWKRSPEELTIAREVVARGDSEVLVPTGVIAALSAYTASVRSVGTRPDYLIGLLAHGGSEDLRARLMLQQWADAQDWTTGRDRLADEAVARGIQTVCLRTPDDASRVALRDRGFSITFVGGPIVCQARSTSSN